MVIGSWGITERRDLERNFMIEHCFKEASNCEHRDHSFGYRIHISDREVLESLFRGIACKERNLILLFARKIQWVLGSRSPGTAQSVSECHDVASDLIIGH